MRIQSIEASNFKSLIDFKLDLAKFNCLIGLNGVGKSTVLQFIDFLGQQVSGDFTGWLKERNWQTNDINSRLTTKRNVTFDVSLVKDSGEKFMRWQAVFNTLRLNCTWERIETPSAILEVEKGQLRITKPKPSESESEADEILNEKISFLYQGSILSQLKPESLPKHLVSFRNYFTTIKSLDLLSPESLRQRTREASGSLGRGGQRLSAFLYELGTAKREKLVNELQKAYRQLSSLNVTSLRSGWKQLEIFEHFGDKALRTEARHINDGMLRLMAILAELETKNQFLLFDEIENGINPELVEVVIDKLVNARQQVLVTTHSPMILNYLDDETARAGVIYLYKTPEGHTQSIPFFSIPSLAEKLTVMGPGEAFVDTNLTQLADEIAQIPTEEA